MKRKIETEYYSDSELRVLDTASPLKLILSTLSVIVTNSIALYGVLVKDWSSFTLLVLFLVEGVIVLVTDLIKLPFRNSGLFIEKNLRKTGPSIFAFECLFIGLFGFIILMALGPRQSDSLVPGEVFIPVLNLIVHELRLPILFVLIFRLQRLFQDFHASGAFAGTRSYPLGLDGGGWMMLLFFLGILMPFLASDVPNAFAGLVALILLKTIGEILGIWAIKLALLIPEKHKSRSTRIKS